MQVAIFAPVVWRLCHEVRARLSPASPRCYWFASLRPGAAWRRTSGLLETMAEAPRINLSPRHFFLTAHRALVNCKLSIGWAELGNPCVISILRLLSQMILRQFEVNNPLHISIIMLKIDLKRSSLVPHGCGCSASRMSETMLQFFFVEQCCC